MTVFLVRECRKAAWGIAADRAFARRQRLGLAKVCVIQAYLHREVRAAADAERWAASASLMQACKLGAMPL